MRTAIGQPTPKEPRKRVRKTNRLNDGATWSTARLMTKPVNCRTIVTTRYAPIRTRVGFIAVLWEFMIVLRSPLAIDVPTIALVARAFKTHRNVENSMIAAAGKGGFLLGLAHGVARLRR